MLRSLFFACLLAGSLAVDYSGYKVIRATPRNEESVEFINKLQERFDLWKASRGVGYNADIMVAPRDHTWLMDALEDHGIEMSTMIEDVQPLFDAQMKPSGIIGKDFDYDDYHDLDAINKWIDDFSAEHSSQVSVEHVTYTFEGKSVRKLVISKNPEEPKPIFFMIGGTHSREWVTPATMMYIAKWLVSDEGEDSLADQMEFHIIPVFNQDGYVHTWTPSLQGGDRMWRKTRSPNTRSDCVGTDPNRNYAWQWGTGGSSKVKCSDTYMGPSAASEIEIRNLQDHILGIKDRVEIFMDVHAYGHYWMYPWGYTTDNPEHKIELHAASKVAVDALRAVYGTEYEYGSIADVIYVASGSSADWTYNQGIKHSYALELRDDGNYGFTLPADQIKPNSEEFYAGIGAMVRHILNE